MANVVLITGASSGIGRSIAEQSLQDGHTVYGGGRSFSGEEKDPNGLIPLHMDVTMDESVQTAIDTILSREGKIDCLINCAGIGLAGPLEETPIDEAKSVFETNLFGTLRTTQTVLPSMRANGYGKIINIGSIGGQIPLPFRGIYGSSKSALEALSHSLSMEVRPFGIDIYSIHPGDFSTNINKNRRVLLSSESSPYKNFSYKARKVIEKEVDKGSDPAIIAELVQKILEGKKRRGHYRAGKRMQKLIPFLRKVLPAAFFEQQVMRFYHIDKS